MHSVLSVMQIMQVMHEGAPLAVRTRAARYGTPVHVFGFGLGGTFWRIFFVGNVRRVGGGRRGRPFAKTQTSVEDCVCDSFDGLLLDPFVLFLGVVSCCVDGG